MRAGTRVEGRRRERALGQCLEDRVVEMEDIGYRGEVGDPVDVGVAVQRGVEQEAAAARSAGQNVVAEAADEPVVPRAAIVCVGWLRRLTNAVSELP